MGSQVKRGFTLFEVLIVVMMIGLLAAFMWPDFGLIMRAEQLDESVTRTKALVAMCRAQAMNESRRYRITLLPDGRMLLTRQKDSLLSPNEYVLVGDGWAQIEWLLDDVWVEAVLPLPDGPPPLLIDDDVIEFAAFEEFPEPLEEPFEIDFEPDGSTTSVRWVLRELDGRGRELTLDGRLGRVTAIDAERVDADGLEKPERVETDYESELEVERGSP